MGNKASVLCVSKQMLAFLMQTTVKLEYRIWSTSGGHLVSVLNLLGLCLSPSLYLPTPVWGLPTMMLGKINERHILPPGAKE